MLQSGHPPGLWGNRVLAGFAMSDGDLGSIERFLWDPEGQNMGTHLLPG